MEEVIKKYPYAQLHLVGSAAMYGEGGIEVKECEHIKIHGQLPHGEVVQHLRSAHVAALVTK